MPIRCAGEWALAGWTEGMGTGSSVATHSLDKALPSPLFWASAKGSPCSFEPGHIPRHTAGNTPAWLSAAPLYLTLGGVSAYLCLLYSASPHPPPHPIPCHPVLPT